MGLFTRSKMIVAHRSSQKPGSPRMSSPLIFAGFQYVTFCQQLVPFFLSSWLSGSLLEFKKSEMGVAMVGRFVFKSERFHERLKLLDVCKATGHLGNPEFATGSRG